MCSAEFLFLLRVVFIVLVVVQQHKKNKPGFKQVKNPQHCCPLLLFTPGVCGNTKSGEESVGEGSGRVVEFIEYDSPPL